MPTAERRATLTAAAMVPVVSVSLWLLGFRRTAAWVERSARGAGQAAHPDLVVREAAAALTRVRRYTPWTGRCLARALVLWWLLRRRGIVATLHLGTRMNDGQLDAHAWVMRDGRVLADSQSVLVDFPGAFASSGDLTFGGR